MQEQDIARHDGRLCDYGQTIERVKLLRNAVADRAEGVDTGGKR
jgi:hypothetical protein